MNIGPLRQLILGNLHDRTDHDERPGGTHFCDLVEQLGVESFVDHAVKAEPWARQVFLVGRIELVGASLAEVRTVD